jgi:hypothetical protein
MRMAESGGFAGAIAGAKLWLLPKSFVMVIQNPVGVCIRKGIEPLMGKLAVEHIGFGKG